VYGVSSSNHGYGVLGVAQSTTGVNNGVRGESASDQGFGMFGWATSTTGNPTGVEGASSAINGYGVYGAAFHGTGVNFGVYGLTLSSINGYAGYFSGRVQVLGNLIKSGGGFQIDHPTKPENRFLEHSFVEAPERLNVYSGTVTLDARGQAAVRLPGYFQALNTNHRYQLTAMGKAAPDLHVARKIVGRSFRIAGGAPGQEVCWLVTGVRQDSWARANPIVAERPKRRRERGRYLHPELLGRPSSLAMHEPPRQPRKEPRGSRRRPEG
jgi:hypothetical protein